MIYEDLKNKRVLVTGSSSGIGQATAIMFAQQGSFVGVHYFRTKDGADFAQAAEATCEPECRFASLPRLFSAFLSGIIAFMIFYFSVNSVSSVAD